MRHAGRAFLLLSLLGVSCTRLEALRTAPPSGQPGASPREADGAFVDLTVPGFDAAVVSVPLTTGKRRPLLVAAHGAWDRPEPHCRLWRRVTSAHGFVLCPRGKRTNRHVPREHAAYFYPNHFELAREALAAIEALSARYPDQLDRALSSGLDFHREPFTARS